MNSVQRFAKYKAYKKSYEESKQLSYVDCLFGSAMLTFFVYAFVQYIR